MKQLAKEFLQLQTRESELKNLMASEIEKINKGYIGNGIRISMNCADIIIRANYSDEKNNAELVYSDPMATWMLNHISLGDRTERNVYFFHVVNVVLRELNDKNKEG